MAMGKSANKCHSEGTNRAAREELGTKSGVGLVGRGGIHKEKGEVLRRSRRGKEGPRERVRKGAGGP